MRTEETDPRLPESINKLLNCRPFLVDTEDVVTWSIGYGARADDDSKPDWSSVRVGENREAMFMNAPFFLRLTFTIDQILFGSVMFIFLSVLFGAHLWYLVFFVGVFVYIRYTPEVTGQIGWGHKLNGRWAILCRPWHPDKKSAQGTLGPNLGQATGWRWGPH